TTSPMVGDWGEASCLALVAALERGETDLLDPDALATPWSTVARLARTTPSGHYDSALGFAQLLTPGWCKTADIGGPAWIEQRFRDALDALDATSTELLAERARLLGQQLRDEESIARGLLADPAEHAGRVQ